jgi:hypothetical protein
MAVVVSCRRSIHGEAGDHKCCHYDSEKSFHCSLQLNRPRQQTNFSSSCSIAPPRRTNNEKEDFEAERKSG